MSERARSVRAEPFHCPYCGDEDLRPHGAEGGAWECRSCLRAFRLSLLGLIRRTGSTPVGSETPS